ncbi:MAG: NosD domain-containing protein [Candidatus Paceibacterota bacterium]
MKKLLLFVFVLSIFVPKFVFAETYTGDIYINSTGGGNCTTIGVWDDETKTCTFTKDLFGPLTIGSVGITIDGAGHTMSRDTQAAFFQRNGMTVGGSNFVLKNINVKGFTNCIIFNNGTINSRVENSTISSCGSYGIYLPVSSGGHIFLNNNFNQNFLGIFVNSSNNTIEGNIFSANNTYGIRINNASNNIIKNNILIGNFTGIRFEYGTGNRITENTIENSKSYGLYAIGSGVNQNYVVNNNFINNRDGQAYTYQIQLSDVSPIGGNYWSDYDAPSEGCNDLNIDSICDQPKYLNPYDLSYGDFYPWVRRDGWKTDPPTCFDGIKNQDETDIDEGGVCKVLSSEKSIVSFSFDNLTPKVVGVINEADHTISATVPFGIGLTDLIPSIAVSAGASVNPENGTSQNFTNTVMYNVTAEDKSTQEYAVTVTSSCTVDCFSSVLFLPGLESSRLYTNRESGSEDQLWEPNTNSDVEDLYLNTDGTSKNLNIYTRDIIKETNVPIPVGSAGQNIYKSFSAMMDVLFDDHKIAEWKEFAYDWRQDVQDIIENGTKYQNENKSLVATLQALVDSSKNGKVTIVAHSNGGLIAKALLNKLQDDKIAGINNLIDNIDVLILVAVPEIGTASAVPAVLHGYKQNLMGGLLMDEAHARELGRNMISAFGLLPSREYLNRVNASPATFVDTVIPSNVTTKLVQAFGSAISSYDEYKDFLFGREGRTEPTINQINLPISLSQDLFTKAETLHNIIDEWVPPESLRVVEVAGWGLDTIASFEYYPKICTQSLNCGFTMDERPRFTANGDGTVVVPSAQYMSVADNAEKYWVDLNRYNQLQFSRTKHASILEVTSLLDFISNTIQEIIPSDSPYLSTTEPLDTSNRFYISIHSPVTLDAFDTEGNHTGKICPTNSDFCYVEENIPNSSYLQFGEGKYLNLREEQMFKVKLQGTDVGTFTYESEKVLPDGTSTTSSFVDIPVTIQTQAEITLNVNTQTPELKLDVTGDGVSDFTITPNDTFDPILYLQIMKATIDSLDISPSKIKDFDKKVDNVIKEIKKGKTNKAQLKIEKFKSYFTKTLSKPDPKKPKPNKISKADAQLLLDMLNKLLDNLK